MLHDSSSQCFGDHLQCSCVAQYNAQPIWLSPSAIRLVYSNVSDTCGVYVELLHILFIHIYRIEIE